MTSNNQNHTKNSPVKVYIGGKIIKRRFGFMRLEDKTSNPYLEKGVFNYQSGYALKYFQIIRLIARISPARLQRT